MRISRFCLSLLLAVSCGRQVENQRYSTVKEVVDYPEVGQSLTIAQTPIVTTPVGPIRGIDLGERGAQYLGIPFAQPPIGGLRWRQPVAAKPFSSTFDAIKFGSSCPQFDKQLFVGSEDCLYLNVWHPKSAKKLPVMVFVHGGANLAGSADVKIQGQVAYDGSFLASETNVVVVTINYRLGALGFFAQSDGEKASELPVANLGLEDQLLALQWVKQNIEAFGGDKNNVTLFGESAGSWNSCNLLAAPRARGLFQRAILQSGACKQQSLSYALSFSRAVRTALGCKDISCMRSISPEKLLTAANIQMGIFAKRDGGLLTPVYPIVGDAIRPRPVASIVALRQQSDVPIMLGSNQDELLVPQLTVAEFTCAIEDDADLFSAANRSFLYRYLFDHKSQNGKVPAIHAIELQYLFGYVDRNPESPQVDIDLGRNLRKVWGTFARTGNPNVTPNPLWKDHEPAKSHYMRLAQPMSLKTGSAVPPWISCPASLH